MAGHTAGRDVGRRLNQCVPLIGVLAFAVWCGACNGQATSPATLPSQALPAARSAADPLAARGPGKVVVSGVVPDEGTRDALVRRLIDLYGADRVVVQLTVDKVSTPANWKEDLPKLISSELKQVRAGELRITDRAISLKGTVDSTTKQQQVASSLLSQVVASNYKLTNGLVVAANDVQAKLNAVLEKRIVEFESAKARLTPTGERVLDDLLPVLAEFAGKKFEVVGHTDADGTEADNLELSRKRAETVKVYLSQRGIPPNNIIARGVGSKYPVDTKDKAKNRRIEFREAAL